MFLLEKSMCSFAFATLSVLVVAGCSWSSSNSNYVSDGGKDANIKTEDVSSYGAHGEHRITFLSSPDGGYDAYGNTVVYTCRGKAYLIDLEDETEEHMDDAFFSDIHVYRPSIWENMVVFESTRKIQGIEKYGLALFDLEKKEGKLLESFNFKPMRYPQIHKKMVVWSDYRYFDGSHPDPQKRRNTEICLYNVENGVEHRVTDAPFHQTHPDIYDNRIVWLDQRDPNQSEVYVYNIVTGIETNITKHSSEQWAPRIWGNSVVWMDLRNGSGDSIAGPYYNTDIYYTDLDTGDTRQITDNQFDQEHPKIFGRYIIWNDLRDGKRLENGYPSGANIYLHDLQTSTEKRVTWSTHNDGSPRIAGERIIWLSKRDSPCSLYMKYLESV